MNANTNTDTSQGPSPALAPPRLASNSQTGDASPCSLDHRISLEFHYASESLAWLRAPIIDLFFAVSGLSPCVHLSQPDVHMLTLAWALTILLS